MKSLVRFRKYGDTVRLSESLTIEHKRSFKGKLKRLTKTNIRASGDESRVDIHRNNDGEKILVVHKVYKTDVRGVRQVVHQHKK